MNAKQIALGGWMTVCALSFSTLADSASLTEEWHARQQSSLAAPSSTAIGNGTIITSTDGLTWTKRNSKSEDRLQAVSFANGQFIATAKNGQMISSPDGKRWNTGAPTTDLVSVR